MNRIMKAWHNARFALDLAARTARDRATNASNDLLVSSLQRAEVAQATMHAEAKGELNERRHVVAYLRRIADQEWTDTSDPETTGIDRADLVATIAKTIVAENHWRHDADPLPWEAAAPSARSVLHAIAHAVAASNPYDSFTDPSPCRWCGRTDDRHEDSCAWELARTFEEK